MRQLGGVIGFVNPYRRKTNLPHPLWVLVINMKASARVKNTTTMLTTSFWINIKCKNGTDREWYHLFSISAPNIFLA